MATRTTPDYTYTPEQDEWLREKINVYRYKDLVAAFNERFGTSLSYDAITSHCLKTLKIKRGPENQFGFSKGRQDSIHNKPIGYETFDGLVLWVKVSDEVIEDQRIACQKSLNPNWRRKKEVVWEAAHGPVPDGMMLLHLNKDRRDCRLENLYLTTRKINFMMSKNGWHSENPELTKVALKWCELYYTLRGEQT